MQNFCQTYSHVWVPSIADCYQVSYPEAGGSAQQESEDDGEPLMVQLKRWHSLQHFALQLQPERPTLGFYVHPKRKEYGGSES